MNSPIYTSLGQQVWAFGICQEPPSRSAPVSFDPRIHGRSHRAHRGRAWVGDGSAQVRNHCAGQAEGARRQRQKGAGQSRSPPTPRRGQPKQVRKPVRSTVARRRIVIGTRMFGHARGDEARKRWPVDFALGVLVAKFNIYIYIFVLYCIILYPHMSPCGSHSQRWSILKLSNYRTNLPNPRFHFFGVQTHVHFPVVRFAQN